MNFDYNEAIHITKVEGMKRQMYVEQMCVREMMAPSGLRCQVFQIKTSEISNLGSPTMTSAQNSHMLQSLGPKVM